MESKLNNLVIRHPNRKEVELVNDVWLQYFPNDSKDFKNFHFKNIYKKRNSFILCDNNQILSFLQWHILKIKFEKKWIKVPLIYGVMTFKGYEKKGYMSSLMEFTLSHFQLKCKFQMALIQAYKWEIYNKFNFLNFSEKININLKPISESINASNYKEQCPKSSRLMKKIYYTYAIDKTGFTKLSKQYFKFQIKLASSFDKKVLVSENSYVIIDIKSNQIEEYAFIDPYLFLKEINALGTTVIKINNVDLCFFKKEKAEKIEVFTKALYFDKKVENYFNNCKNVFNNSDY